MISPLRATAILASSSLISAVIGVATAKAWALLLGPIGLGRMALLQNLVAFSALVAGLGIGAALVRNGANTLGRGDTEETTGLIQAATILACTFGCIGTVVLMTFSAPISRLVLGSDTGAPSVELMGLALLLMLLAGVQASTLNAHRRVHALARVTVLTKVLGSAGTLAVVWFWRNDGIAPAIVVGAAVSLGVSYILVRREIRAPILPRSWRALARASASLLRFGVPYTASSLVGTGVQLVIPVLVLHGLGPDGVGFYQAASAISVTYLGFLSAAMFQEYYPRLSGASDDPRAVVRLVNQQHRLTLVIAAPMLLGMLALAPFLLPILYSQAFTPALELLEWQLVGDVLKFSSWTIAIAVLARNRSGVFFLTELAGGTIVLFTTLLGIRLFGLPGVGIAYVASYALYYLLVTVVLRRSVSFLLTRENLLLIALTLAAVLVVKLVLPLAVPGLRTPIALAMALAAAGGSAYLLRNQLASSRPITTHTVASYVFKR